MPALLHTLGKSCACRHRRQARNVPEAAARAATRAVLPVPGEPSSSMARRSCIARTAWAALRNAVGALKSKGVASPAKHVHVFMCFCEEKNHTLALNRTNNQLSQMISHFSRSKP